MPKIGRYETNLSLNRMDEKAVIMIRVSKSTVIVLLLLYYYRYHYYYYYEKSVSVL